LKQRYEQSISLKLALVESFERLEVLNLYISFLICKIKKTGQRNEISTKEVNNQHAISVKMSTGIKLILNQQGDHDIPPALRFQKISTNSNSVNYNNNNLFNQRSNLPTSSISNSSSRKQHQ